MLFANLAFSGSRHSITSAAHKTHKEISTLNPKTDIVANLQTWVDAIPKTFISEAEDEVKERLHVRRGKGGGVM